MKYTPIHGEFCKNRKYIGEHWNKKYLRGIQSILLATHGVVGPRKQFFEKAFGKNVKEFMKILTLPEIFIIYRNNHLNNGDRKRLDAKFKLLDRKQKSSLMNIILANNFNNIEKEYKDKYIVDILKLYKLKS